MKKSLIVIFCFQALVLFAQTGPGGVGTSATNVLWLDPNYNMTTVGSGVNVWFDKSGNGNNATAPSASARPTLVTNALNGYSALDFDGVNDELRVPDAASLDLTAWHFFVVIQVATQKDYNAWLTKGNDGSENYEMLSYSDGNLHTPILTSGGRSFASTAAGQFTTTEYNIIEYSYSAATNRDAYKNGSNTNLYTDAENRAPTTNGNPLYIGNEAGTTGRNMDGNLTEVIMYNTVLNATQRRIILNYLSAKYNIALSNNNDYAGDDGGNGNYDHNVIGVGRVSATTQQTTSSSSVGGGMGMEASSGLGDGEYIYVGNNQLSGNQQIKTDVAGMTGTDNARWERIWYLDETGNFSINITFDFTDAGIATTTPATASNYVLLRRNGTSGSWTEVTTASSITGDVIAFNNVAVSDGYYTLGSRNAAISPLPVEMIDFAAQALSGIIQLGWTTVSEINNASFTIERSTDGIYFSDVTTIATSAPGGNSQYAIAYSAIDTQPLKGVSYYRIKIMATDGSAEYSETIVVTQESQAAEMKAYYDDATTTLVITPQFADTQDNIYVSLYAVNGSELGNYTLNNTDSEVYTLPILLSSGVYICQASSASGSVAIRFFVP